MCGSRRGVCHQCFNVSRESICNGDDDQKCRVLEYEEQEIIISRETTDHNGLPALVCFLDIIG